MDKSLGSVAGTLNLNQKDIPDIRTYSPLTLAYIGDSVYELIIRTKLVTFINAPVNKLNKQGSELAKAATQAWMIQSIEELLSETELDYYKRGRNAKSYTSAKNASITDYRKATGFEALVGYLYLTGQDERMMTLVGTAITRYLESKENTKH